MSKNNYGWIICIGSAMVLFCTSGLTATGFTAYQPYLISIGGLTNTQASTVVMFRNLFGLLSMLSVTSLIHRFEIRRIVTLGMLLCGISFVLYGCSVNFLGYCIKKLINT